MMLTQTSTFFKLLAPCFAGFTFHPHVDSRNKTCGDAEREHSTGNFQLQDAGKAYREAETDTTADRAQG